MITEVPESTFDPPVERCHLCGSDRIRRSKTDHEGRRIDRCLSCRIEFLNPQFTDEYLERLYEGYGGISETEWTGFDEPMNARRAEMHHYYLGRIESYTGVGRFLGVGCGDAMELRVARERGWEVQGHDIDPLAVRNVERELGVRAFDGEFPVATLDGPYDCIYLHHVLEHPKNPQDYLRRIHSLLTPNGAVMLASPNLASLSSGYKNLVSALRLKGTRFKHYDAWQHLFFYTPRKLGRLLERCYDFEVLERRAGVDWRTHGRSLPVALHPLVDRLTFLKSKFFLLARRAGGGRGVPAAANCSATD